MSARGAPLRFVATVALCWIGARIVFLWPQAGSLPEAIRALAPVAQARAEAAFAAPPARRPPVPVEVRITRISTRTALVPRAAPAPTPPPMQFTHVAGARTVPPPPPPPIAPLPAAPAQWINPLLNRWSASGWLVARAGRGIGAAPGGGQLGGGQAGVRLAYLLARRARISAFGRATAPLAGRGSEAAIGIEWQPLRAPVRLVAEQRFGIDGIRGGTGLGLVGGLDERVAGFRLEGYGQAGMIRRTRSEPYADGAARLTRPVGGRDVRLSLGAGIWGAAQRDAERLDIGPSAVLTIDTVRVTLDWRQRIAGSARPGSGLALTLGGDF